jgi:anti-sigma B factor antagonist
VNLVVEDAEGGAVVIRWSEPAVLDAANADELREQVADVQARSPRIVFDMGQVEFIDSAIIGALVGFLRRARASGGDVKLAGLTPDIETIFEVTRLNRVFSIHPSVDAALDDFRTASKTEAGD